MAISAPSLDTVLIEQLRNEMAKIAAVDSVCFAHGESAIYVWVGVRENDDAVWGSVLGVEEHLSGSHPNLVFEFHVIPLESGRSLEDYVSIGQHVFHRAA